MRHHSVCRGRTTSPCCNCNCSTVFGDLYWPQNASRGFVSISWTSCNW